MAKKQLKIKLLPNGEIKMQTLGIKGKRCLDYSKLLEELADAKIVSQELTSEYYETEEYETEQDNLYN
mgnify:CR=1 FL=1